MKSIFASPIDEIDLPLIEGFLNSKIAENVVIDYKQDFSNKSGGFQTAKAACAMANSDGGVVLFGVEEDKQADGRGVPKDWDGVPADGLSDRILQACLDRITPPLVPEVKPIGLPSGKELVLMRVREGPEVPYSVADGAVPRVYVRAFDKSQPLNFDKEATPTEIEWLLNRRRKSEQLRESLFAQTVQRCDPHEQANVSLLVIAIAPQHPRDPLLRLDELEARIVESGMLPMNADISTASESVCRRVTEPTAHQWWTMAFCEMNAFGQVAFGCDMRALPPARGGPGDWPHSLDAVLTLRRIIRLTSAASELYKKLGFNGSVSVRILTRRCRGNQVLVREVDLYEWRGNCLDQGFEIQQTYTALELAEPSTTKGIYQTLLHYAGYGPNCWQESVYSEHLRKANRTQIGPLI